MRTIKLLDTTLRDGEQSPGCSMHINEKIAVADALQRLNVDIIEAGYPAASEGDFEAVRQIAKRIRTAEITGLARCKQHDIDVLWDALKEAENPRLHLFIATSPIHLAYKYKITPDAAIDTLTDAIRYAKKYTDNVQFSFEDASRTPLDYLVKVTRLAVDAGVSTINIPDTVGCSTPDEMANIVKTLLSEVDGLCDINLSVHCHDDLGLAVANSLSAVKAGANQIEGTVLGIGERAGNADLEEIIMALKTRGDYFDATTRADSREIYRTCTLLSSVVGLKIPMNKAIVGRNAFAHEAGIHQHGVMQARETYEIMNPHDVGIVDNKILIGKHSGKHAFQQFLSDMGYTFSSDKIDELFEKFKALADRKKTISRRDVEALLPHGDKLSALVPKKYALEAYDISSYKNSAFSEITLKTDDGTVTEKESGDGPVDASFKAINNIVGKDFVLSDFSLHSVTEGEDALGEAIVKLDLDGRTVSGRGVSTDVLEAAIIAYVNAVNKLLNDK